MITEQEFYYGILASRTYYNVVNRVEEQKPESYEEAEELLENKLRMVIDNSGLTGKKQQVFIDTILANLEADGHTRLKSKLFANYF